MSSGNMLGVVLDFKTMSRRQQQQFMRVLKQREDVRVLDGQCPIGVQVSGEGIVKIEASSKFDPGRRGNAPIIFANTASGLVACQPEASEKKKPEESSAQKIIGELAEVVEERNQAARQREGTATSAVLANLTDATFIESINKMGDEATLQRIADTMKSMIYDPSPNQRHLHYMNSNEKRLKLAKKVQECTQKTAEEMKTSGNTGSCEIVTIKDRDSEIKVVIPAGQLSYLLQRPNKNMSKRTLQNMEHAQEFWSHEMRAASARKAEAEKKTEETKDPVAQAYDRRMLNAQVAKEDQELMDALMKMPGMIAGGAADAKSTFTDFQMRFTGGSSGVFDNLVGGAEDMFSIGGSVDDDFADFENDDDMDFV